MTKLVSFLAFALFLFSACEGGRVLNSQDEEPATLGKVGDSLEHANSKSATDEDPAQ